MKTQRSVYFPNLVAIFLLALAPFSLHFWFLLPVAVSLLIQSKNLVLKFIPVLAFGLTVLSLFSIHQGISALDALSLGFFFLEGLALKWLLKSKASLSTAIFLPLFLAVALGLILWLTSHATYQQWVTAQAESEIFPYFFKLGDWPEPFAEIYGKLLQPLLQKGLLAWFASMIALCFFVNGVLENLLRNLTSKKPHNSKVWDEFNRWKAPDSILIALVLGLALLAYSKATGGAYSYVIDVIGWHLSVLSMFPIFIQGIALASFFIPRVSLLLFILIFTLLILEPIPVLMLAGLSDLWFDFRSKIRSDPRV